MVNHGISRPSLFLFLFVFLLFCATARAEVGLSSFLDAEKTISMDLQDASLKDVLKIFSIQSGLNFIASEAVKDRKVTLYLDSVPIKEAMTKLFTTNKLIYDFDEEANIFTVHYADDASEPDMVTRVYPLKHRTVASSNFEKERQSIYSGTSVVSGSFSTGTAAQNTQKLLEGTSILDAVKQVLSKKGKAVEDSMTNSIIVTDVLSRFTAVNEVIAMLDVPQPQVMLEVEMLDVSKNSVDALGFNHWFDDGLNPLTLVLGKNKNSLFMGQGGSGDSSLPLRGATIKTSGIAGNVVIGSTYAAILDFLKQQQDTKFLARPRILTMNNETAEIGITKDEIVSKKVEYEVVGDDTRTSTEYERATSLKLTPEGIGIFLRVTPQINLETGDIILVVNPKTSSTTQSDQIRTEVARDPEVRSTKSIVKIKDGDTVILGGLIHQEKDQTRKKMPFLGDLPLVGAMFRHKETERDIERELLVFITPHIIKDPNVQYSRPSRSAVANPVGNSGERSQTVPSERRQAIANMLNTFER